VRVSLNKRPSPFAGGWRRLSAARMVGALPLSRLRYHLPVITFLAIGHLFALTLILVVPLYADGVNTRLLRDALRTPAEDTRPRTSISLKHYASLHGPVTKQGFDAADAYIKNNLQSVTALQATPPSAYIYSDKLRLMPADLASDLGADPIDWAALGFDDTLFDRIQMVEGRLPERRGEGETLEVILSQTFINKHGLRTGDVLVLRGGRELPDVNMQVQIVGVWQPTPPVDERWPLLPFAYEDVLLVPRETYTQDIAPVLNDSAWYSLVWYTQFPPDSINVSNNLAERPWSSASPPRTRRTSGTPGTLGQIAGGAHGYGVA
jgi:hypothetical protein